MGTAFVTSRRVEFADTDAAGIMHFAAFFRLMEQAEHELLRSVGLSVVASDVEGPIGWPRVNARCDFQSPAHFEDVLTIEVRVARLGEKSVTYRHQFTRDGALLATGEITAVCCRIEANRPPRPIVIPATFAATLKNFALPPGE
jgi:acyl-CoA thioester hydrolase